MPEDAKVAWVPLESNPEALNKFIAKLGITTAKFVDVWGLDDELLQFVPQPVIAVILLLPYTQKIRQRAKGDKNNTSVIYFRQTVTNACGAMAIIHASVNNANVLDGALLQELYARAKGIEPEERGGVVEHWKALSSIHAQSANVGQTAAPRADAPVSQHFVAFVKHENTLYELDGTKDVEGPISHGPCNDLLKDASAVIKRYMQLEPDSLDFTVMALTMGAPHQD